MEVRVEVDHRDYTNRDLDLTLSIYPKNFHGPALENLPVKAAPAGPGSNEYRTTIYLGDFRKWDPGYSLPVHHTRHAASQGWWARRCCRGPFRHARVPHGRYFQPERHALP